MKRTDIAAAARFVVICQRCGTRSPAYVPFYLERWVNQHERDHPVLDQAAYGPLLDIEKAR